MRHQTSGKFRVGRHCSENMKPLEKIELISLIGRELQSRMTYSDIDQYFAAVGVKSKPKSGTFNSKWVYVKEILGAEADDR